MKTTNFFAAVLLACTSAAAQTPVVGNDYLPWEDMTHSYCAQREVSPGVFQPLPGKEIIVTTTMRFANGGPDDWHTHQTFDPPNSRPVGMYLTPTIRTTALTADGTKACVEFTYRNAGYAGIIETRMEGLHAYDNLPPVVWANKLTVPDYDYNGVPHGFVPFTTNAWTGPQTEPVDTRHWDTSGHPGYSRYSKEMSRHVLKTLLYSFGQAKGNAINLHPRILRGMLPSGGDADNEMGAGAAGYLYGSWITRSVQGKHRYGVEWDIENPAATWATGHSAAEALDVWLSFKAAVIASKCQFGKFDEATGIPITDANDTNNVLISKEVVHVNCLLLAK